MEFDYNKDKDKFKSKINNLDSSIVIKDVKRKFKITGIK